MHYDLIAVMMVVVTEVMATVMLEQARRKGQVRDGFKLNVGREHWKKRRVKLPKSVHAPYLDKAGVMMPIRPAYVATSSDLWSNRNQKSFISSNGHRINTSTMTLETENIVFREFPHRHLGTNVLAAIKTSLYEEMGIPDATSPEAREAYVAMVSDDGSDMKFCRNALPHRLNRVCANHRLQNAIKSALSAKPKGRQKEGKKAKKSKTPVARVYVKINKLVKFTRQSNR